MGEEGETSLIYGLELQVRTVPRLSGGFWLVVGVGGGEWGWGVVVGWGGGVGCCGRSGMGFEGLGSFFLKQREWTWS
jgi:hypothetical protein